MWQTKHFVTLGVASAVSLAGGYVLGSTLARRKLEAMLGAEFEERLEREVAETAKFFQSIDKDTDPEELAEQILQPYGKSEYNTISEEIPQDVLDKLREAEEELETEAQPLEEEHNAFENPAPSWVQQDEELERRNGVPYVISHDEFYENKWEFEEGNLIWYERDGTLADSRDEPISNETEFLGEDFDKKFGHGSNDPNIVYVCNEKMEMVFEVCRSNKSYAEDVLGYRPDNSKELKHSARARRGRDE